MRELKEHEAMVYRAARAWFEIKNGPLDRNLRRELKANVIRQKLTLAEALGHLESYRDDFRAMELLGE